MKASLLKLMNAWISAEESADKSRAAFVAALKKEYGSAKSGQILKSRRGEVYNVVTVAMAAKFGLETKGEGDQTQFSGDEKIRVKARKYRSRLMEDLLPATAPNTEVKPFKTQSALENAAGSLADRLAVTEMDRVKVCSSLSAALSKAGYMVIQIPGS